MHNSHPALHQLLPLAPSNRGWEDILGCKCREGGEKSDRSPDPQPMQGSSASFFLLLLPLLPAVPFSSFDSGVSLLPFELWPFSFPPAFCLCSSPFLSLAFKVMPARPLLFLSLAFFCVILCNFALLGFFSWHPAASARKSARCTAPVCRRVLEDLRQWLQEEAPCPLQKSHLGC